jgi:predicted ATPase
MINSIVIEGYRILDGFRADLGELTVVIGANATGKSTLMDCLQFISNCVQFSLKDAVNWQGGLDSVLTASKRTEKLSWELTFQKPMQNPFLKALPLKEGQCYVYEVVIEMDQYQQAVPVYEVLRTEKPYGTYEQPFKLLEATRYKSHIFDFSKHELVPFDEAI